MKKSVASLLLIVALLPLIYSGVLAETEADPPDQEEAVVEEERIHSDKWYAGHDYRNWIYDQNAVDNENSNLDEKIEFIVDGKVRKHPEKVYFYNNFDAVSFLAADTKLPIAFWVFSDDCRDCLYDIVDWGTDPEIVERSWNFINVYVDKKRDARRINTLRMMSTSRSVQFYLPGLRRLRAAEIRKNGDLVEAYDTILEHVQTLTEAELMEPPVPPSHVWDKKIRNRRDDQGQSGKGKTR